MAKNKIGCRKEKIGKKLIFDAVAKHDLESLINIIHNLKIVCFSQKDDSRDPLYENLMWSHYADGLRGFCLVFKYDDIIEDLHNYQEEAFRPIAVKYQDTPNTLNLFDFNCREQ